MKKVVGIALTATLALGGGLSVNASTSNNVTIETKNDNSITYTYKDPVRYDKVLVSGDSKSSKTGPSRVEIVNGKVYEESVTYTDKAKKWSAKHCNDSDTAPDSKSYTSKREVWAEGTLGAETIAEADFAILTAGTNYSAEADLGGRDTISYTTTWEFAPNSISEPETGSIGVNTVGVIETWEDGWKVDEENADADYSTEPYSSKHEQSYTGSCEGDTWLSYLNN